MISQRAATLLAATCIAWAAHAPAENPQALSIDAWRSVGAAHLTAVDRERRRRRARDVILFIGDGMGIATVTATRIRAGQLEGGTGEEYVLPWETFPHSALVKTYNSDAQTPDSAGTMSAIMTGVKTRSGVVSVDAGVPRGDCAASEGHAVSTLLERAERAGRATGVVSTARITHATPAATYAHSADRDWEAVTPDPACHDIAAQLLDFDAGDGIDVLFGGGRQMFLPSDATDPEDPTVHGLRRDGRDLIEAWRQRHPQGRYLWNEAGFEALPSDFNGPVLGLFEPSHMKFATDRSTDPAGEPSLADMTARAIDLLSRHRRGYFLMVEAGRIDHANHAGNAYRALAEGIALADAVDVALATTRARDTLIIVTADHAHTLTLSGYARRGAPILGLVDAGPYGILRDSDGLPYTILNYANGPGHRPRRTDLSEVDTTAPDYRQEATVPLASETHSGVDVAAYARGPGAQYVTGVIEQPLLYYVMARALGVDR